MVEETKDPRIRIIGLTHLLRSAGEFVRQHGEVALEASVQATFSQEFESDHKD